MKYTAIATLMFCLAAVGLAQTREHAETTIAFQLPSPPTAAFPLFGPVRESEWSPHWNPRFLFPPDKSQSAGAVFTTGKGDGEMVWMLADYDPIALRIGYVILWPGMCATKLDIVLKLAAGDTTEASVTYRQTALSEPGDKYVKSFASDFPSQRDHWQHAVSQRLLELKKQ